MTLVPELRSWISPFHFCPFHSFHAIPSRNHLVSDLFQSHTCAFFSAFARATYSLSVSNQCLGLEFNAPYSLDVLRPRYSIAVLPNSFPIRGCHSLWPSFPRRFGRESGYKLPTSPCCCQHGFSLPCIAFIRITNDILVDFSSCVY